MATVKTTQKELFTRIAERCGDDPEIIEFCERKIAQLDKPRKPRVNQEAIDFAAAVASKMAELGGPLTNKELAGAMDVSPQKMAAALRRLVNEGAVERHEGEKSADPAVFTLN